LWRAFPTIDFDHQGRDAPARAALGAAPRIQWRTRGAQEPIATVRQTHLAFVPFRYLGGVRLDLGLAFATPHDQLDP
jgi:hypothetical protein